jgi:glycosyltransferase involved in cell wall biosynthesis
MKVLWTSLVMFPDLCLYLNKEINVFGGWMNSSAEALKIEFPDVHLAVVIPNDSINKWRRCEIKGNVYYLLPCKSHISFSQQLVNDMREIIEDCNPQIIHINGVEHCIGLAVLKATNGQIPVVASIQGLAHVYHKYVIGGLSNWQLMRYMSLRDIMGESGICHQKKLMRKRGILEIQQLKELKYVIGRTEWDKSHCFAINPSLKYYHCNENLRPEFYHHIWSFEKCKKYSLFVSNGTNALKGLHKVIQAMPIILREFPETQLNVVGFDYRECDRKDRLHMTAYHRFITKMIRQYNLNNHISFIGILDEKHMCDAFLNAHVYVLPSCIENSPNSLGEAQLIGVPVVASYVGGVPSMISEGETGFMYRYEEHEMMAERIISLFKTKDFKELSNAERTTAIKRHNWVDNSQKLYSIYKGIIDR